MRITQKLEQRIVDTLVADREGHIILPPKAYRSDGSVHVVRDGLTIRFVRHLWFRTRGQLTRKDLLRQVCPAVGCQNPYHWAVIDEPNSRTHCPKGHPYSPETDLPGRDRCAECKRIRDEKRPRKGTPSVAETNAAKTHCPKGHEYVESNIYWSRTKSGGYSRKCRACQMERDARRRATPSPEGAPTA